jgi:hypothetical protein
MNQPMGRYHSAAACVASCLSCACGVFSADQLHQRCLWGQRVHHHVPPRLQSQGLRCANPPASSSVSVTAPPTDCGAMPGTNGLPCVRACGSDGSWSATAPKCAPSELRPPPLSQQTSTSQAPPSSDSCGHLDSASREGAPPQRYRDISNLGDTAVVQFLHHCRGSRPCPLVVREQGTRLPETGSAEGGSCAHCVVTAGIHSDAPSLPA